MNKMHENDTRCPYHSDYYNTILYIIRTFAGPFSVIDSF